MTQEHSETSRAVLPEALQLKTRIRFDISKDKTAYMLRPTGCLLYFWLPIHSASLLEALVPPVDGAVRYAQHQRHLIQVNIIQIMQYYCSPTEIL